MVFGEELRLPGEFFVSADGELKLAARHAILVDLRQKTRQMRQLPPFRHGSEARRNYVTRKMVAAATHVFVRVGVHKGPLQPPYHGLFKVMDR